MSFLVKTQSVNERQWKITVIQQVGQAVLLKVQPRGLTMLVGSCDYCIVLPVSCGPTRLVVHRLVLRAITFFSSKAFAALTPVVLPQCVAFGW